MLYASESSSRRTSGGASDGPCKYDELSSFGIPSKPIFTMGHILGASVLRAPVRSTLVAHDRDQVPHEQARVDQVQAPAGAGNSPHPPTSRGRRGRREDAR